MAAAAMCQRCSTLELTRTDHMMRAVVDVEGALDMVYPEASPAIQRCS
jgi:hypothetical protein